MPTKHVWTLLITVLAVTACSEAPDTVPVYQVKKQELLHQVQADGELMAVNSVSISAPASVQGPRFIASLATEFSNVSPGDVVVTFDASQLEKSLLKANTSLNSVQADEQQKRAQQDNEKAAISLDKTLNTHEFAFADRFSIDDVQIRSRLEILDSLQNKDYLDDKRQYLNWQDQSFSSRSQGELKLLQLQLGQQQSLIQQAETGLAELEIKAPHKGILLFDTNWRGEKPEVGGMVFPGQRIGSIPDLSLQHIKLQVIEQEAVGLAEGQTVNFVLAAWPDDMLQAKVVSVAAVAQSRDRRDPRKYIEVKAEPLKQDARFMPGNKVRATLQLNQIADTLTVPLQAIFNEQQQLYVYKQAGSGFVRQQVIIGAKSLSHAQITDGLAAGDRIALIKPEV